MTTETLIQELLDKNATLDSKIAELNNKRDEYALDAVMGDDKAQQAIEELDAQITPLQQEKRTIETAVKRLELQIEEERKSVELENKRTFNAEFEVYRDEVLELAKEAGDKIRALRPVLEELNTLTTTKGFKFSARAELPHRNLRPNSTFEKCMMHATGLNHLTKDKTFVNPGIQHLVDPSNWFNGVIFDYLNRVGEVLAKQAEVEPVVKSLTPNMMETTKEDKAPVKPKRILTKIKVVRVSDGLDVVRCDDGKVIMELKDAPTAFSEWFNAPGSAWKTTFELVGTEYPEEVISAETEPGVKVVHKGKGYWQIQDETGRDLLDDPIQGKDNCAILARQMGLSVN